MSLEYINRHYGLSVKVGDRVRYTMGKRPRVGTVVKADGAYLSIRFDGETSLTPCHPTWRLEHLEHLS